MAVDIDFERSIYRNAEPVPAGSLFETFADQVLRRAQDALAGRDCQWPLGRMETAFLALLTSHQGERRAVTRETWAQRLQIEDRVVRDVVHSLRRDFGIAIGSSSAGGYFLCETRAELDAAIRQLRLHAVTTLRVASGMMGGRDAIDSLLQQCRLDLTTAVTR